MADNQVKSFSADPTLLEQITPIVEREFDNNLSLYVRYLMRHDLKRREVNRKRRVRLARRRDEKAA